MRALAIAVAVLHMPKMRERLLKQGFESTGGSAAAFATYLRSEMEKWTRVVREARIRPSSLIKILN
jgi:tripartite-type tricarboxylate transporter receptor subunit TctC